MIECLSREDYLKKFQNEVQLAEDWIKSVCDGYEEIIITSDHYPFGVDCPICLWIIQKPDNSSYKIYDVDWNLFDIDFLPETVASNEYLADKSNTFFIKERKNKYGWNVAEVEPFGFVEAKFQDTTYVDEGSSIHELLDTAFSYIEDEYHYEKYTEECNEDGVDCEKGSPVYDVTEISRVSRDDGNYGGSLYLNLYLVARR